MEGTDPLEIECYENGDVGLYVRHGPIGGVSYWLRGGSCSIEFRAGEWAQLRELLEAYWEETDNV